MSWENPKTNWGQPGQTVPGVDDFNRIEGNTEHLQTELTTHEKKSASVSAKGHVQLSTSTTSTSTSTAATPSAVKAAMDKADEKMDKSGGEFTGITKAHSNTSYTTKQIRNIILSPDNANVSLMADGDIWMKYK